VVGGAVVLHWHHALRKLIGFWVGANHAPGSLAPRFPAGHEVRFYKKHADAGFFKVVFEAGPVGALRQPERARRAAEVPPVRVHAGPHLESNRIVVQQQWEVPVRRGTGRNFDVSARLQLRKGAQQVGAYLILIERTNCLVAREVELGGGVLPRFCARKTADIRSRAPNPPGKVFAKVVSHQRVAKLLCEDRRHVDGHPERAIDLTAKPSERAYQRQIAFERRFMEPLLSMRPTACETAVREVAVEDKRCCSGHTAPFSCGLRAGLTPNEPYRRQTG